MSDELTRAEVAQLLGIAPNTWGAYVARGQAPAPVRYVGRTPLWSRQSIEAWADTRPGRGGPGISKRPRTTAPRTKSEGP